MVKIHSPNPGYAGRVGSVVFADGVADVDKDTPEFRYFERHGYGIGRAKADSGEPADKLEPTVDGEPVDARDFAESVPFGSPLRDAAVDPRPADFLPPTNAGEANPHGPKVVAPGIHAIQPGPIRPGETHVDDPAAQESAETALAEQVLVEGEPATVVAEEFDPDKNMGPLGLSDPGSAEQGVVAAAEASEAPSTTTKPKTRAGGPKGKS